MPKSDHYGPELEIILAKMLLVSQIAHLGRQIDSQVLVSHISDGYAYGMGQKNSVAFPGLTTDSEDEIITIKSKKSTDEISKTNTSPENGFGQSLLDAGIGGKLVSNLSKARLDASSKLQSSKNVLKSSSTRDLIFALLEEWEEPAITANAKVSFGGTQHKLLFYLHPIEFNGVCVHSQRLPSRTFCSFVRLYL